MALKIDICEAFDTLSWSFVIKTLDYFGFNDKFCKLILVILKFAYLSIGLNGKQVGFFYCSNGVRQGVPLSPLIFSLAEEVLSREISKLVDENQINLIRGSKNCHVPHTLYVDDVMFFCRGDHKSIKVIPNLLTNYDNFSGQSCNTSKSLIYVGERKLSQSSSISKETRVA